MNWAMVSDQSAGGIAVEHARYATQRTLNGPARLDKFGRITLVKKKKAKTPKWDTELLAKLTQVSLFFSIYNITEYSTIIMILLNDYFGTFSLDIV